MDAGHVIDGLSTRRDPPYDWEGPECNRVLRCVSETGCPVVRTFCGEDDDAACGTRSRVIAGQRDQGWSHSRSLRASWATKVTGSWKPWPTLSTPFDFTLDRGCHHMSSARLGGGNSKHTSVDFAMAANSPALPLITVACQVFSRTDATVASTQWEACMQGCILTIGRGLAETGRAHPNRIEHDRLTIDVRPPTYSAI